MTKKLKPVTREQRELCCRALLDYAHNIAKRQAAWGDLTLHHFTEMCNALELGERFAEESKNAISD